MDRTRLEAFSDGVFAVAITLLALNLTVEGTGHGTLASQLGSKWPAFLAYVISFFTIGIIWVNHHVLLSHVIAVDRVLLFLNLLLLLFVVMVPFGTATVADFLGHGGFDAKVAVAVYGGVMAGMSLGFGLLFEWMLRSGQSRIAVPPGQRRGHRVRFMMGNVVYWVAVGLAFANAIAGLVIIGGLAVYYIFERTPNAPGSTAEPNLLPRHGDGLQAVSPCRRRCRRRPAGQAVRRAQP